MGGVMSLFTVLRYNHWFSKAAVISPALLPAMEHFKREIQDASLSADTRIFFSWGTAEDSPENIWHLEQSIRHLESLVQSRGIQTYLLRQEGGVHNESSWERQVPVWMNFLWY